MRLLIVQFLMWFSSTAFGGWDVKALGDDSSSHSSGAWIIVYNDSSESQHSDFPSAISTIRSEGQASELKHIALHALVPTDRFQEQLLVVLAEQAPEQLAQAMDSSGNLHNPALEPLREELADAILAVPLVQDIADELSSEGLTISNASFEKVVLQKNEDAVKILFFLWLSVRAA